jgi:putative tributyrin esterase
MPYRNPRLSEPKFERDGLRFLTFKSPALKARGDVALFVPPDIESLRDVPLVILLHGVYGSHWSWAMMGGAHLTARQMIAEKQIRPLVIAMPSDGLWGDGSGYVKHDIGDYERWIMEDVVGCVTEQIPALSAQSPVFLAGLSMGGFGALRLGAKYAAKLKGISAHSAITHYSQLKLFVEESLELYTTHNSEDELSPLYWLQQSKDFLPPLRFDCGKNDLLIEANRQLHTDLTALDIPHQYFEFAGEHNWAYWRAHLRDTLLFFAGLN